MNTGLEPDAVSQLIHIYFFIISFECCEKWRRGKRDWPRANGTQRVRKKSINNGLYLYLTFFSSFFHHWFCFAFVALRLFISAIRDFWLFPRLLLRYVFFLLNFAFLLPHLRVMTTTTKIRRLTIDLVFLVSLIACGVYDVGRRREKKPSSQCRRREKC